MPPQQVFMFIIGTVAILFGAYYVTYFIGMKASGQTRAGLRNRNIVVHDRYSIARDKGFYVVEVAGRVYILGVTTNAMTLLDTYDSEEFALLTENNNQGTQMPWGDTPVGRYGNKLTQKVVSFIARKTGKMPPEEEPASFKDSMREAEKNASPQGMAGQARHDDKQTTQENRPPVSDEKQTTQENRPPVSSEDD